jgi:hypothetical protein
MLWQFGQLLVLHAFGYLLLVFVQVLVGLVLR